MSRIRQIYIHPDYNGGVSGNDIALLELAEPIYFDYRTQAIDLEPSEGECGEWVVTYGFGRTNSWFSFRFNFNRELQMMHTRVQNYCYPSRRHNEFIVTQVEGQTVCNVCGQLFSTDSQI